MLVIVSDSISTYVISPIIVVSFSHPISSLLICAGLFLSVPKPYNIRPPILATTIFCSSTLPLPTTSSILKPPSQPSPVDHKGARSRIYELYKMFFKKLVLQNPPNFVHHNHRSSCGWLRNISITAEFIANVHSYKRQLRPGIIKHSIVRSS